MLYALYCIIKTCPDITSNDYFRWTDRVVSLDIQQDIVHRSMGSGGKSQLALFSDASRLLLNAPPVYTSDNATTQNSFPYIHFHLVFASFGDLTTLNESLVPLISTCGGPCQIQHSCRVVIFIPKYCIGEKSNLPWICSRRVVFFVLCSRYCCFFLTKLLYFDDASESGAPHHRTL